METTSRQPNPIPNEQVIIDFSVAYGYPVDTQPSPLPSAATVNRKKMSSKDKRDCYLAVVVILILIAILGISFLLDDSKKKFPRFQLDSVSFNRAVNITTAVWDIGFSIDKPVGDLGVWVQLMAGEYKVDSMIGIDGNTTVSVSTLMPQGLGGLIRLEQVMFRCYNYKDYLLEAACKDVVVVGFSSNENSTPSRGVMEGGPRLCPVVNHKHI